MVTVLVLVRMLSGYHGYSTSVSQDALRLPWLQYREYSSVSM